MSGADRLAIDRKLSSSSGPCMSTIFTVLNPPPPFRVEHIYRAFIPPEEMTLPIDIHIRAACSWGRATNVTQSQFGLVFGGEFSAALNEYVDCLVSLCTDELG